MHEHSVLYRREGRYWTAELVGIQGVATFGRTLTAAKAAILEATALWFDVAEDQVHLTHVTQADGLTEQVQAVADARRRLDQLAKQTAQATADIAQRLRTQGWSVRDVAEALGVSFQRVQQLAAPSRAGVVVARVDKAASAGGRANTSKRTSRKTTG